MIKTGDTGDKNKEISLTKLAYKVAFLIFISVFLSGFWDYPLCIFAFCCTAWVILEAWYNNTRNS